MADATNPPVQPPDAGAPVPDQKKQGFFSTTAGKVVLGLIGLFVLLSIVGVVVAMVAFGGITSFLNSGDVTATTTTTTSVSTTSGAEAVPVLEPAEAPLSATFTFRNVFAPSIKPPVPAATETSSTATGSTDSPDTLYLTDIVNTDSRPQCGLRVERHNLHTGEGGTIPGTPWKVVSIGTDSVVMLYGDSQVTLTVGQGMSK